MIELYINSVLIEGLEDDIVLTKAVNDIGDLPSRQGEYSNTISVPMTKGNCAALGLTENVGSGSQIPKQVLTYELLDLGVLISYGSARLINVKEGFEIVLLSNNSDWTGLLKDRSLQDLDVSEYDYNLIPAQVASKRLITTGRVLANIWYGEHRDPAKPFDVSEFQPSFYFNYLLALIYSEVGYTLVNNLRADSIALLAKMVTIQSKDKWMQRLDGYAFHGKLYEKVNMTPNSPYNAVGGDYITKQASDIVVSDGFPITGKDWFANNVSLLHPSNLYKNWRIKFVLKCSAVSIAGNVDVVAVMTHGTFIIGSVYIDTAGVEYTFDFTTANVPTGVTTGTGFAIDLTALGASGIDVISGDVWLTDPKASKAEQIISTTWEYKADVGGALPDIKQSDFLLYIFNLFCVLVSTDSVNQEVTLVQLDTLLDNIPNAVDWSSKVDLTEQIEIEFDFWDNYFQSNRFSYKQDDRDTRIAGSELGLGKLLYPNANLPTEGDLYESVFTGITRSYEWNGVTNIQELAQCESRTLGDLNWKVGVVDITTENRITQWGQAAPSQSAEVSFTGLNFQEKIDENYLALKNIFENTKALRMLIRLTRSDFADIDFGTPVFIDVLTPENGQVRGHFYVNKIEQYKAGSHAGCYVQLIQID